MQRRQTAGDSGDGAATLRCRAWRGVGAEIERAPCEGGMAVSRRNGERKLQRLLLRASPSAVLRLDLAGDFDCLILTL